MKRLPTILIALVLVGLVVATLAACQTGTLGGPGQTGRQNVRGIAIDYKNNTFAALDVDQKGTGNIATFRDSGTAKLSILDGGGLSQATDTQNGIGFSSWDSAAVITTTNGALWTVPTGQVWIVAGVFCKITTNFDCTGDDCALTIGDGNDADGFLVLADAAMQATDTEGTGWPAGYEGFAAATVGAYLDGGGWGFPYAATDTIDIDIKDASDSSNPTAGAATCWLNYTRIQ